MSDIQIITYNSILENLKNRNNSQKLVVLIGFSPDSLSSIQTYKLLDDKFPQAIEKFIYNPDLLMTVVNKLNEKKEFFWCTAEEYQFYLQDQLDKFFDIQFIYNNLYHFFFPIYYTFENFNEIYKEFSEEDSDIRTENFEHVSKFYSSITRVGDTYGAYTFDESIIERWEPFYKNLDSINLNTPEKTVYDFKLELSEDQLPFIDLTNKLLVSNRKQNVCIIHSNDFSTFSNRYLERLTVLKNIHPELEITFTKRSLAVQAFDETEYLSILDEYWGYSSFRSLEMYKDPDNSKELIEVKQSQIIHDIVEEVRKARNRVSFRDIFITSSTGAGKSIMFQLPSFLMYKEYQCLTIVISPLVGLMTDQVESLKKRGIYNAATINSNITPAEKADIQDKIKRREIAMLYISPETLLNRDIKTLIGDETEVGLFIVDEAHIVTTWGKAFRSDYWYLGTYLQKLRKEMKFPIATFTATAIYGGEEDMYKETRDSLGLINPKFYLGKVKRDDIEMHIDSSQKELKSNEYERAKFKIVAKRLKDFMSRKEKVLIYFPTIPLIRRMLSYMEEEHPSLFKKTVQYYGKLQKACKDENHSRFASGDAMIMFATKAYGMGIDLADINIVYHYAPTGNLCDYVQEIGRAARGEKILGKAYFDFLKNDFSHIKRLHGMSTIRKHQLQLVAQKIYSIYKEKKRSRNLLVNVEDFEYIFTDNKKVEDGDVEGKLKTALLLLEKDFVNRIGYSPFVARPRGIFSREYFCVTPKGETILKQKKYSEFSIHKQSISSEKYSAIYEINLKDIWEKNYRRLSFPDFKRRFHEKDESIKIPFINELDATFVINFASNESIEYTLKSTNEKLVKISNFFSGYALTNKYFKAGDLASFIKDEMKSDAYMANNLAQIILHSMVRYNSLGQNANANRVIRFNEIRGYQVAPSFEDFFKFLNTQSKIYLNNKVRDTLPDGSYNIYMSKSIRNAIDRLAIVFGVLEALNEVNYQIQGGNTPEIYIRINSTLQLESMIKHPENYQNEILNSVHYRHKLSIAMMKYIFECKMDTKTFWNTIEDYFLGRVPDHVLAEAKHITSDN
ncbi:DEAD/DEAH box helicase [Bacillus cereus]|uniref:DEAD/DEAH box helicase n=1 Tax=Bacillus cereus TaxID=1396 RepID=UPI000BF55E37|nr:DEAD/DEAH box helicase [Bacillus cereus]PER84867.1 helicase [Bacillus cereus]